jgi:hypothetical protein
MPLTLWRGEQLLGKLLESGVLGGERTRSDERPLSLMALLIPSSDGPEYDGGVWQIHRPTGELGVQQILIEPDVVANRSGRTGSGALELLPPERNMVKTPRELQLTVRNEKGQVFLPQQIQLEKRRYESARAEIALGETPPESIVDGCIWLVSIAFAPDLRALPT